MSGGSYDYLYVKDVGDLHHCGLKVVERMRDRLAGLGYAPDAAAETAEMILTIRQYEVRVNAIMRRLSDVWQAVEWLDSCDGGEDGVRDALVRYRGEEPPTKMTGPVKRE